MIRKLGPNDIDKVMDIWLRANIGAHRFIDKSYWRGHFDMVKGMLPGAEVFVWDKGGAVCGFVGLMEDYIAGIFVEPGCESRGIGKALLDYVKGRRERLSLHVYAKNDRAASFYLREGFAVTGEQLDENTGERELVMVWTQNEVQK